MKIKSILFLLAISPAFLLAQNIIEEMADQICTCIGDDISDMETLNKRVDSCSAEIIVPILTDSTSALWKNITTVEDVEYIIQTTHSALFNICPQVRHTVLISRRALLYAPPSDRKATYYFELGGTLYEMEEYLLALEYFKLANKAEKQNAVIYDYLGMCYLKQNQTDKAIKYFKKSLKYYADSDIALLQLAQIYFERGEYSLSQKYYERFQHLYPESPDGYYGLARLALHYNRLDNAAEWGLIAYTLYEQLNYDDLKPCANLLKDIYAELDKVSKTFLFKKIIKDYKMEFHAEPWLEVDNVNN